MRIFIIELAAAWAGGMAIISTTDGMPDDDRLFAYCAVGSVCGSFAHLLRVQIYQRPDAESAVLITFFWNAIIAGLAGPFLCGYLPVCGVPVSFRSCAFLSMLLCLTMPWLFDDVFPVLGASIVATAKKISIRKLIARVWGLKLEEDDKPND